MSPAALLLLSAALSTVPGLAEQFRGVLEPNLVADSGLLVTLTRVPEVSEALQIPKGSHVFSGTLLQMGTWEFRAMLVEPPSGSPFIFIDTDQDRDFEPNERFSFTSTRNRFGRRRLRVALPPPTGSLFGHIPLELLLADRNLGFRPSADERYLLHAVFYATAKVRIDGGTYFFRYVVSPDTGTIDLSHTLHLIDKGRLTYDYLSPWRARAKGRPPVFRIGNRYVATKEVDAATRTVVIETRRVGDYKRVEWYRGVAVPDFPFEDLEGREHRLSDFRGRYILLNVWSPNCGACDVQFPYLRAAAERFGRTDLVILGLTMGYPLKGSLKSVSPGVPPAWIVAAPRTVQPLNEEQFQIDATPTTILLDRSGRVLVLEHPAEQERPLSGDELLRTLEEVIRRDRR